MHPSDVVRKYVRKGTKLAERYQVEDFIGSGAYGSIFSAIDTVTMERVAVKALPPPDEGVNETAIGRFQREMKVISTLRHSNIITMYDYGETDDHIIFMVLEFVDGPTLFDRVSNRSLTAEQTLDVTRQIAQGLKIAHDNGVIHRDLKPQNIMLIEDRKGEYQVKVLDFGMAKLLTRINDESIIQLTREGVAVGTPRYIAPEQARGKQVGPYSDLYALGLLMYEMATGARAVKADSIESAILAHVSREPLKLDEADEIPEVVRPILYKLIEKNPKKRYQDAGDVIADIEEVERSIRRKSNPVPPKAKAKVAGESKAKEDARLRSIHSADDLRLDYERFDEYAPKNGKKGPTIRRRSGAPLIRFPNHTLERAEAAFALLVAPIAFVFLTAHLDGASYPLRLLVGLLPTIVAALASLLANTTAWRWSFFRLWLILGVVTVLGSHIPIRSLVVGLLSQPAWFLQPFTDIPGVSGLASVVEALSRTHISVLSQFSPELGTMARNILWKPPE